MTRISMAKVMAVSVGALALVGCLLLGATGRWPSGSSLQAALAHIGGTPDYIDSGVRIVPPSATSSEGEAAGDDASGTSKTDFEGDEVSPALATYGIDRDGNLFEVHSPHTEVPRLPGPTI